jgi:hypothetical protein
MEHRKRLHRRIQKASCEEKIRADNCSVFPPPLLSFWFKNLGANIPRCSPGGLVENWILECKKWFHEDTLRLKLLDENEWLRDRRPTTVWMVKDTNTRIAKNLLYNDDVIIQTMVCDEWHLYGRSDDSNRIKILETLIAKSKFVVQMSGTMFPLGPKQDARVILKNLAGPWDLKGKSSKWSFEEKAFLKELFKKDSRPAGWSVLKFRVFIGNFFLRRTTTSTWDSQYIIKETITRPVPKVVKPKADCPVEKQADDSFNKTYTLTAKGDVDFQDFVANARTVGLRAWSGLYDAYYKAIKSGKKTNAIIAEAEKVIDNHILYQKPSHRLKALAALVNEIVKRGERFVIASDRLFLLRLAVAVCPNFASNLDSRHAGRCVK